MFNLLQARDKKMARRDVDLQETKTVIRFPITVQNVVQSRRRQTAYDGLERLTLTERAALGLDTGLALLADDAESHHRGQTLSMEATDRE